MPLTVKQKLERRKAVRKAAKGWEERLVDVSGRNPLRNYHDRARSTLDLTPSNENEVSLRAIGSLLAGRAVRMTTLFPSEDAHRDVRRRLTAIHRMAQANSDEKGIDTLFAAAGLATWKVETGSAPNAPVILIPLKIIPTNAARSEFNIIVSGDPHINPVLAYILQSEYDLSVSKESGDIADGLPGSFNALMDLLKTYATKWSKRVRGFDIAPRLVVANFKYANMAMVDDLANNADALADNDIVAAIAGVKEARDKISAKISDEPFNKPDIDSPESEYLILDADSSQHNAINRALGKESLVVWGPPGTGKSQVIANLIAALIAKGKRVLFVAEKRAAIDVVTARLDAVGLSDLVMDAHGGIGSKREFAQKMGASLSGIKRIPEQDYSDVHTRLARTRDRLIKHKNNVHDLREPWGISVFEIQSKLIDTPEAARTALRIHSAKARNLDTQSIDRLKRSAQKWVDLGGHKFSADYPEWYQAKVETGEDAGKAFNLVRELDETLPDVHSQISAYLDEVGLTPPNTVSKWGAMLEWLSGWANTPSNIRDEADVRQALELVARLRETLPAVYSQISVCLGGVGLMPVAGWGALLEWLSDVEQFSTRFSSGIYELDHDACVEALAPAYRWYAPMASVLSSHYRDALNSVRAQQRTPGMASALQAIDAVEQAKEHLHKWNGLNNNGSFPKAPSNLEEIRAQANSLVKDLKRLGDFLPRLDALNQPYAELEQRIRRLAPPNMKVCSQTRMWALESRRADLREVIAQVSDISQCLQGLADFLPKLDALNHRYAALADMLRTMAGQQRAASNLPAIREFEREFERAGVTHIVKSAGNETPPKHIGRAIEYSWLTAVWEDLNFQNSDLNNFTSATHNRYQREFAEADRHHIDASPKRILRAVAEAATQAMNKFPDEHRLVLRESTKKRSLLPVRELFRRAPNVITAIRPCWAMSPLLVAETIPIGADANMFDVVIFDEASQIPPEEAICSLARAPQAIIAGDHLQLPPTNFFSSGDSDDEQDEDDYDDAALTVGTESILDVARAGLIRDAMLEWHYRSRDARLIAFSNVHIYEGNLTAFPGTAVKAPFTRHLVEPNPSLPLKTTNSHPDEVAKVVDLIIEHARECPDETLGVIAFGIKHANNIEEALRVRLRDMADSSLDEFFSATARERFFVKNIETVQGDERDVIILSVGYHKNASGRLLYRFGPLNQDGGERRLNVAVTRARSRIHLVSSFSHQDMDPGRSKARGVELLRQYLEFAASDGSELGAAVSDEPLNPFEMDVKRRLEQAKIPVTPQYGVAGYRIDFACAHPERTGDMVLAIEADGASYHSGHTARDRDRLRQEVLESKGWRFHRIWSTDWFRDPEGETREAVNAWKQAVRDADNADLHPPKTANPQEQNSQADANDAAPARTRRPNIIPGQSIGKYHSYQLEALARWILSDTLKLPDEDVMAEMRKELGFKRRGKRVDAALKAAIKRAKDDPIDWTSIF